MNPNPSVKSSPKPSPACPPHSRAHVSGEDPRPDLQIERPKHPEHIPTVRGALKPAPHLCGSTAAPESARVGRRVGAPGIGFAVGSLGGLSRDRKANRSQRSFLGRSVSIPSGIIESLLTRVYLTRFRGTASWPSPGLFSTMRCSLSSTTKPVRLRPSLVTTVTVW